jgi:hypothetical protein
MAKVDQLTIDNKKLAKAWQEQLPQTMNKSDSVKVAADEGDPNALRVFIETEGRSGYSFDFKCTYMDSREIKVDLIDVQQGNLHVDEHTETIQTLIHDYARHMHECAQALQVITHY